MNVELIKVLLVEDNPGDARLLRIALAETSRAKDFALTHVERFDDALKQLNDASFDVCLLDLSLPDAEGLTMIERVRTAAPDVSVVVLTGLEDETRAMQAMQAGAQDYLIKSQLDGNLVVRAMRYAVERHRLGAALELNAQRLQSSEERFRSAFDSAPIGIAIVSTSGSWLQVNRSLCEIVGYSEPELLATTSRSITHPNDVERDLDSVRQLLAGEINSYQREKRYLHKDGQTIWVLVSVSLVRDAQGKPLHFISQIQNISKRKRVEEALLQRDAILEAVSFAAEHFLRTSDWEKSIAEVLKRLCDATRVSRAYIFENHTNAKSELCTSQRYEYVAPGIKPQLENPALQELCYSNGVLALWEENLGCGGVLQGHTKDFPIDTCEVLEAQDIVSIIAVPIFVGPDWWGFFGFDECVNNREWSAAEVDALRVVGSTLGAVIQSQQVLKALRESEARFRTLYDEAPIGYHELDTEGRISRVNRKELEIFGYTADEMLGQYVWEFNAEREVSQRAVKEKLAGRKALQPFERLFRRKNGTTFPVLLEDCLLKDADGRVTGILTTMQDITERKQAEERQARHVRQAALRADVGAAIAESQTHLREFLQPCVEAIVLHLDTALARIWMLNKDANMLELEASAGMYTHLDGAHARVPVGQFKIGCIAEERRPHRTNNVLNDPRISNREWAKREGMVAFAGYPLIVEDRLIGVLATFARQSLMEDTLDALASVADTIAQGIERKRTEKALRDSEEKLRQAQKIEAVGRLAGGIAHDFNNLLTVINGYSEILLRGLAAEDKNRSKIEEIKRAGDRAAALTRQLLAFSRKQVLQPVILNLNTVVADTKRMLRRLIGEDIDLVTALEPAIGRISADPGQIEQVIMNLVVNARDAMPAGGKIIIETRNICLDDSQSRRHIISAEPGAYIMLAVSDTGTGISKEIQERIFEPFFTTKTIGQGTGLGLATVYGIVKQSGGYVWVYSEPEHGTTFKIYLPRVDEVMMEVAETGMLIESMQGSETVLLVEDEEMVRQITRETLEMNGYKVLEATNGLEALTVSERHAGHIDLLITDVVMPKMSGREAAERLAQTRPSMRMIYMSGYTDDAIVHHGVLDADTAFLQKPFTLDALTRKVREVLGTPQKN